MNLVEKEYRFKESKELNEELSEFINELFLQIEGLNDNFKDVTLDYTNNKEKEWEELWNSPIDWFKATLIITQLSILEEVATNLEGIVYNFKEIELSHNKKRQPRMTNSRDCREWLIDEIKPLILAGNTKRKDVANRLGLDEKLVTNRLKKGYGCYWRDYVMNVQEGRY